MERIKIYSDVRKDIVFFEGSDTVSNKKIGTLEAVAHPTESDRVIIKSTTVLKKGSNTEFKVFFKRLSISRVENEDGEQLTSAPYLYDRDQILTYLNEQFKASTLNDHMIYNPVTDRLESDRAIETTLSSLYLGNHHRMSSGGENIFFTNESSKINWYPMWGGLKDMNNPANKGDSGIIKPSARNYSNFSVIELNGPVDTGATDAINQAVIPLNICGVGASMVIEESILPTDKLIYKIWYGDVNNLGNQVFESIKTGLSLSAGTTFEWIYEHPVETKLNQSIYARIDVESKDGSSRVLQIRKAVNGGMWLSLQAFQFSDDDLVQIDSTTGRIPADLLPVNIDGGLNVVGFWDANTNTPDLSTITLEQGEAYQVSVSGNTVLNNYSEWNEFDLAVWIDTVDGDWFRIVSTERVLSVNGRKGEVVITKDDLSLENVNNTSDQDKPISTDTQTALDNKIDVGGDITDLNNDAGYIDTILVDNTSISGDGLNTPLSVSGGTVDPNAIHINGVDEISSLSEETNPVSGSWALIEDSTGNKQKVNISNFIGGSTGSTGGLQSFEVQQPITQSTWNGNSKYNYNVTMAEAVAGDKVEIFLNQSLLNAMKNTNANNYSYGYCTANGTVKVVCKISTFTNIPSSNKFFTVRLIK